MKKFLPKTSSNPQGFTLVELMVVIAIIAILSVIGVTVFSNLQKTARDAVRKADVNAIANAMEVNYNDATGAYIALAGTMFSSGTWPVAPLNGTKNCSTKMCSYCVLDGVGDCLDASTVVGAAQPPAGASFVVCTNLEAVGRYCKTNQRQ